MKKGVIIPLALLLLLMTGFGCDRKQKGPSNLSVGKSKLVDSGLTLEAVKHLKKAEQEEENKLEPRVLLLIAYSQGIADKSAMNHGVEAEYKNQRERRIAELTEAEMNAILQILSTPSRIRKTGLQIFVDKGAEVVPLLLDSLVKGQYPGLHPNFTDILVKIGSEGLPQILETVRAEMIHAPIKVKLVEVIAGIGDRQAVAALKSMQKSTLDAAVAMTINTTLYQLGEISYKTEILSGLKHSNVEVRRASAKAMVNISDVPPKTLITRLTDRDSQMVTDLVKALAIHRDETAVAPMVDILTGELDKDAKQAAINTLEIYVENKLAKTLARRATELLTSGKVSNARNRLYLAQLLKREPLRNQIEAIKTFEDLGYKLHEYYSIEESQLVKTTLKQLLDLLGN